MRTTSEAAKKIGESITRELDQLTVNLGVEAACKRNLENLNSSASMSDEKDLIEYFFRIVWLFRNCQDDSLLSKKTTVEITRMAEYALKLLNIKPYASMHSHLYKALYEARSSFFGRIEKPWLAAWNLAMADAMDGTNSEVPIQDNFGATFREANYYYEAGFIGESLACFQKAESLAGTPQEIVSSRLGIVRCLRIFDELDTSLEIISVLTENFAMSEADKISFQWEEQFILAQREQDVSEILTCVAANTKRRDQIQMNYFLMAHLWCYASKQRAAIASLPGSAWIKRHLDIDTTDRRVSIALKAIKYLEDCYSTKVSIFDKLKDIGEIVAEMREYPPSVEVTVFLAAVSRWLLRVKQKKSAALVISDYQSLSAMLSQGRSNALFNLLADIGESLNEISEMTRSPTVQRGVKVGLERTFLYAEILTKIIGLAFTAKTQKRRIAQDPSAWQADVWIKISQFFVKYASGAMKGPIHKLGQIVLNLFNLPSEAQNNFRSVLWSKSIVHEKSMREVLESELGKNVDEVFAEFNWTPVGVGSVSQVYRARLITGEDVAVKIQYPNLDKIVRQDMAMMSRLLSAARWLFPANDIDRIKALVQGICEREIDFNEEIAAFKLLSKVSSEGTNWRVPRLYPEVSTRRVLTAEFIEGQNLYQFAELAGESEKLEVVKAVNQFALLCVVEAGLVVVDPHPANLIISNGVVYLIDFGCCVRVSEKFVALYREILSANLLTGEARIDAYIAAYRHAGIIKDSKEVPESDIREFIKVFLQQINWDQCGDPEVHKRFAELFLKRGVNRVFGSKEPDFVLAYIGQLLIFHTIHKFGASRPSSWERDMALDILARIDPGRVEPWGSEDQSNLIAS